MTVWLDLHTDKKQRSSRNAPFTASSCQPQLTLALHAGQKAVFIFVINIKSNFLRSPSRYRIIIALMCFCFKPSVHSTLTDFRTSKRETVEDAVWL